MMVGGGGAMAEEWLTLEEAAACLKVAKPTIYRFCSEGCLPFYKLAGTGQRRFKRADVDALLVPGQPARGGHQGAEGQELANEAVAGADSAT